MVITNMQGWMNPRDTPMVTKQVVIEDDSWINYQSSLESKKQRFATFKKALA